MSEAFSVVLNAFALIALAASMVELIFGGSSAAITAMVLSCLVLIRQVRQTGRLLEWARQPLGTPAPDGSGIWDDVFSALNRRNREGIAQREELAQALDRFRLAAEALPEGVVILDEQLQIAWMNSHAAACLNLKAEADTGVRIVQLLREPEFLAYLNDPEAHKHALTLSTQRSPGHFLHLQLTPFSVGSTLLLVRDTTQLHRMATMRRDFVANVSHELKTPLTVTLGFLETLEDGLADTPPAELARYVQMATEQARRMQHLIDELLTLAALETDSPPLDEQIAVGPLLDTIYAETEALSAGGHELALDAGEPAVLLGNASELHSALLNLASNAVHYTPAGGRILLHWRRLGDGSGEFSVVDNGTGIASADIARLTERFFRTDRGRQSRSSARNGSSSGGTGLGLSIVKQVVERHGASLRISSQLGQGSKFSIEFPAHRLA